MYCVAGDTQGNDANTHSSIASHSRKMFGAHRMLLGVGRHLTDEGTGEVGHVDGMMNEGEVPDASALTAAPAPEERNATERITSVPVPEELPASASSVANLSREPTSPQPSAVSPDVDSESVSVEEATASLPEVPSSVGDTFGEATSPQPSAVSPDVDSESVSIEEATESLPEVSSAVNETVAEAPLPTPRALPITLWDKLIGTNGTGWAAKSCEASVTTSIVKPPANGRRDPPAAPAKVNKAGAIDGEGDPSKPAEKRPNHKTKTAAAVRHIPQPTGV